jgi:hypothetical protein
VRILAIPGLRFQNICSHDPSADISAHTLFGTRIWIHNKSHGFGDANCNPKNKQHKLVDEIILPNTNCQSWYKQEQWNKKRSKVINLEIMDDDDDLSKNHQVTETNIFEPKNKPHMPCQQQSKKIKEMFFVVQGN